MGVHNVVIGNGPAAIVANNMQRSFPVNFDLTIGVGGGGWSKKNDIRLGDVVSQPTGTHGGVVQWDFGKVGKDRRFPWTGSLISHHLPHGLQSSKEREITDGIDLQASLSFMVQNKPSRVKLIDIKARRTINYLKLHTITEPTRHAKSLIA
jgi:hypothetical protein